MKNNYDVKNLMIGEVFAMSMPSGSVRPSYVSTGVYMIFENKKGRYEAVCGKAEVLSVAEEFSHLNGNLFIGEFKEFLSQFPEYTGQQINQEEVMICEGKLNSPSHTL